MLSGELVSNLAPDEHRFVPALKVVQFDYSEMTKNIFSASRQLRPGHITPQELKLKTASNKFCTKHFCKLMNATERQKQHQREKSQWSHHEHRSIDNTNARVENDIVISPEQCRTLEKGKENTLLQHSSFFGFDPKKSIVKTIGDISDDCRNEFDRKGWITFDTFHPHMKTTSLQGTAEVR